MKKNKFSCFLILLLILPFSKLISQNAAENKHTFEQAEALFEKENYTAALKLYKLLDSLKAGNANISFKIGYCYLNSTLKKAKAIPYLEEASKKMSDKYVPGDKKETNAPETAIYYLARAYQLNYQWDRAIGLYTQYKEKLSQADGQEEIEKVDHDIETCENGIDLMKHPTDAIITNLGPKVNSQYTDAAPMVTIDEKYLIFTSKRPGAYTEKKYDDGQYYEDIYISQFDNGEWGKPRSISNNINTDGVEAALNVSTDGTKLLIYKDDEGDGNIYMSTLSGAEWNVPQPINAINSNAWETHACFSADERILYFVSDRPGGFGGRDIYKSMKLPNGNWGPPQNLGDTINTQWDEDGIFVHPDGKQIFFSSKGHKSMGGFDIFKSKINSENGFWTEPVNIGSPLNTPDDDIFYVTTPDGKRAYLSTAKDGGYGEKDIYLVTYPANEPRDITIFIGKLVNRTTESIKNNKIIISIVTKKNNEVVETLIANPTTGKFGTTLEIGKSYKISYYMNEKLFYTELIEVPYLGGYKVLNREIPYEGAK